MRVQGLVIGFQEWFKQCLSVSRLPESRDVQEPPDFAKMSVKDHGIEIRVQGLEFRMLGLGCGVSGSAYACASDGMNLGFQF